MDLILGGHDHHYAHSVENDVTILKSGSEFREFSVIDVDFHPDTGRPAFAIKRCQVDSNCANDLEMENIVDGYTTELRRARAEPIVKISKPLETRFARVRTQETNFGDFVADCMRSLGWIYVRKLCIVYSYLETIKTRQINLCGTVCKVCAISIDFSVSGINTKAHLLIRLKQLTLSPKWSSSYLPKRVYRIKRLLNCTTRSCKIDTTR